MISQSHIDIITDETTGWKVHAQLESALKDGSAIDEVLEEFCFRHRQ